MNAPPFTSLRGLVAHGAAVIAAAVLVLASTVPARAAPNAAMQACRADFTKLCKSVQLGGGRGAACLREHAAELSPSCRAALTAAEECLPQARQICGEEAASAPAGVRECLKTHAGEFSAACRAALVGQ